MAGEAVRLLEEVGAHHELALALLISARARLASLDSGLCQDPAGILDEAWQAAMSALDLFLKMEVDHWILAARKLLSIISGRRADHGTGRTHDRGRRPDAWPRPETAGGPAPSFTCPRGCGTSSSCPTPSPIPTNRS